MKHRSKFYMAAKISYNFWLILMVYFTLDLAADKSSLTRKLKHDVIEGVNQLIHEIAGCHEQIAEQAIEHIHQKYFSFL